MDLAINNHIATLKERYPFAYTFGIDETNKILYVYCSKKEQLKLVKTKSIGEFTVKANFMGKPCPASSNQPVRQKSGRKFEPIAEDELKLKLEQLDGDGDSEGIDIVVLHDYVSEDLKVSFDLENYFYEIADDLYGKNHLIGIRTLPNMLTFLGVMSGGDWEYPVFWIVYWDGNRLRGYVPTEGNVFNRKTKEAVGNADEEEDEEFEGEVEWDKIKADIERRIVRR